MSFIIKDGFGISIVFNAKSKGFLKSSHVERGVLRPTIKPKYLPQNKMKRHKQKLFTVNVQIL